MRILVATFLVLASASGAFAAQEGNPPRKGPEPPYELEEFAYCNELCSCVPRCRFKWKAWKDVSITLEKAFTGYDYYEYYTCGYWWLGGMTKRVRGNFLARPARNGERLWWVVTVDSEEAGNNLLKEGWELRINESFKWIRVTFTDCIYKGGGHSATCDLDEKGEIPGRGKRVESAFLYWHLLAGLVQTDTITREDDHGWSGQVCVGASGGPTGGPKGEFGLAYSSRHKSIYARTFDSHWWLDKGSGKSRMEFKPCPCAAAKPKKANDGPLWHDMTAGESVVVVSGDKFHPLPESSSRVVVVEGEKKRPMTEEEKTGGISLEDVTAILIPGASGALWSIIGDRDRPPTTHSITDTTHIAGPPDSDIAIEVPQTDARDALLEGPQSRVEMDHLGRVDDREIFAGQSPEVGKTTVRILDKEKREILTKELGRYNLDVRVPATARVGEAVPAEVILEGELPKTDVEIEVEGGAAVPSRFPIRGAGKLPFELTFFKPGAHKVTARPITR